MKQDEHDMGLKRRAEEATPTVSAGGVATGERPLSGHPAELPQNAPATQQPIPGTWFVAIVKRNSEKVCRDELQKKGITAYVATQTLMRRYAKRRPKPVEYVRIPAKVFVRMFPLKSEAERTAFFKEHPQILSFMPDHAKGSRGWAEIPEKEMKQMREILGDTENEVTIGFPDSSYEIGGKVRAVGGAIHGLEGLVASREGKNYFCVEIKGFDWAKVCILKEHLEPLE